MNIDFANIENKILRKEYKIIGKGSGRIVYDLENGYVVKVAINAKGFAQNHAEHYLYSDDKTGIFARILHVEENHKYIIMEKAEKIRNLSPVRNHFKVKSNKELFKIKTISDMQVKYNLNIADLRRSSSWGLINDIPVIIDYGLTRAVFDEHYLKDKSISAAVFLLLFLRR